MKLTKKLSLWYFKREALPYWSIVLADCLIVFLAYLFVYVMFRPMLFHWPAMGHGADLARLALWLTWRLLLFLLLYVVGMRLFRTYSGIIRYSSFVDLLRVGGAMLVGGVLSWLVHFYAFSRAQFSIDSNTAFEANIRARDIIAATLIATFLMWLMRMVVKYTYDTTSVGTRRQRAAIYGVQSGGIGLAKYIRGEKPARFNLVAFVSPDVHYQNRLLMGCRVLPTGPDLLRELLHRGVSAFIVSPMQAEAFRRDQALQDGLLAAGIKIYMPSGLEEWSEGDGQERLREVEIEDLLPRDEIQVDMAAAAEMLQGSCILLTGSAGSIGAELVRQIAAYKPAKLILIDQAETPQHDMRLLMHREFPDVEALTVVASICHAGHMEALFRQHRPDYVFHAAAYKHVPMMEDNPCEAVLNNVLGTRILADLAVKYDVRKFVMISTDKAVNPTNVMGCSKRLCEIYVQSLNQAIKDGAVKGQTQFVTTRFGNVLGSNGSVIPLFREQLRRGDPLTVTHPDITRFFMLISEACKLVIEAGTHGNGGEIYVFDMGRPVRIADLARRMIRLSGATNVEIKYTGLRDGEKLYEEVLADEETTKPSFNEKIRIATVRQYDYATACRDLEALFDAARGYDDMQTVSQMKHIVPEYKSQHSKYEALDTH